MFKQDLKSFIDTMIDELDDDLVADDIFTLHNFEKTNHADITTYHHDTMSIVFDKKNKSVYIRDTISRNKIELEIDEIVALYLKCREYGWTII